ncbi:hypothetical protein BKA69DRAFT_145587 [Paraphysoderma sedebokerense]|nr:hypothetical protein BKA69DRAFT_145587 [Paraphysoderma sedebokerense]
MGFLAFLVDVLQSLASLSTAFQKRVSEFQITSISSSYRVATLQITQWYLVPNPPLSPTLQEFRKSVQQTTALPPHVSSFRDVSLNRKPNDDSDLINDCIQYCQIIIRNLEERFADIPFITQFSIFVPKRFPDIDSPNFHQYGVNELDSLLEHYGVDKEIDGKTIKKIVDVDSTRFEWSSLKLFVAVNRSLPQPLEIGPNFTLNPCFFRGRRTWLQCS